MQHACSIIHTLALQTCNVLSGILTGVCAYGVEISVEKLVKLRIAVLNHCLHIHVLWGLLASVGISAALVAVACLLTVGWAPASAGSGVALVMSYLNGCHVADLLAPRTLFVKVVGTIFAVASGLPVGPEGPLVVSPTSISVLCLNSHLFIRAQHIGSGIAAFFTRQHSFIKGKFSTNVRWLDLFHNDNDRREFISSGAAAGEGLVPLLKHNTGEDTCTVVLSSLVV